jgi:leucyl-tRNA synthetase
VLAPEHAMVERLTTPDQRATMATYVEQAGRRSMIERQDVTREKSGVFTGAYALHPATAKPIPIWVADYVLTDHGTGAIMAVPAHDERDFAFATRHDLPVVEVISPDGEERSPAAAYTGAGQLVRSGPFTGGRNGEAGQRIAAWLAERAQNGPAVSYRLRDWCISRQRYWGPPIPMIHCDLCGAVPVPEKDLPVLLPHVEDFRPDGSGQSPLDRCAEFVATTCPRCGTAARRETDVSDNFLDSSWYFLRYPCAHTQDAPFEPRTLQKWLPVDMYIGGKEHSVLHLMYTRFVTMALHDLGLVEFEEPFKRFRAHGLLVKDGAKMSKSRCNVVNPDAYLDAYGADTLRMFLMFLGPFQQGGDFRDRGVAGVQRFLERMWRYVTRMELAAGEITNAELLSLVHRQTGKVTESLEQLHYNTGVAALMELLNGLTAGERHYRQAVKTLLQLCGPYAPFITQELWEQLGEEGMINDAPWPECDPELVRQQQVTWVVQVNGRVRDRLELPPGQPQEAVEDAVFQRSRVQQWTEGKERIRTIFVPDKLINIVTR